MPKRFAILGNGKAASDVIRTLMALDGAEVGLALGDRRHELPRSRIADLCAAEGIAYAGMTDVNAPEALDRIAALAPDYILSVNNFQILGRDLLRIPSKGTINFHNGPLPDYAGVNVCSWAILNGETRHGVTWHLIDEGIDSGPIVARRLFDIPDGCKAVQLILRCIAEGVGLFKEFAPRLVTGDLDAVPQDARHRRYFWKSRLPFDGFLPFHADAGTLDRLCRALSFNPLPNDFYRPKLQFRGATFHADRFSVRSDPQDRGLVGSIMAIEANRLLVGTRQATVEIRSLSAPGGPSMSPEQWAAATGAAPGDRFTV